MHLSSLRRPYLAGERVSVNLGKEGAILNLGYLASHVVRSVPAVPWRMPPTGAGFVLPIAGALLFTGFAIHAASAKARRFLASASCAEALSQSEGSPGRSTSSSAAASAR